MLYTPLVFKVPTIKHACVMQRLTVGCRAEPNKQSLVQTEADLRAVRYNLLIANWVIAKNVCVLQRPTGGL